MAIVEPASSLPETQTMTVVAKALVRDNSTAIVLGLLGFSATKLWNTAIWELKEIWQSTGKILSYNKMDKHIKETRPKWYRCLHSQSSQAVLEEIGGAYRSWFALREKGNILAKPPGFRKRDTLSPVTFKQNAVVWDARRSTVRLSIPKGTYGRQYVELKVVLPPNHAVTNESLQVARLVYEKGDWYVHLVQKIAVPEMKGSGEVMAMDLNIKHFAGSFCTDGGAEIWSGGELLSLERYFDKQKAKTTKSRSRKSRLLNRKRSRQRMHIIHSFTRSVVRDAHARGVSTVIVGYPKNIRDGKNWGSNGNQQLHRWPYRLIFTMLRYKARLLGIRVVDIGEEYTSRTCSRCGSQHKNSRVHRGLYICSTCGVMMHADINAAVNILVKHEPMYLPGGDSSLWSSGCLAQPVVNRFVWRNTRPSAHESGTWRRSTPQLQTESVYAIGMDSGILAL
jgi:putative transposase